MAQALAGMTIQRAFVVHGAGGWDEPTPVGPFTLFDVRPGNVARSQRAPADYGLQAVRQRRAGGRRRRLQRAGAEAQCCAATTAARIAMRCCWARRWRWR